MPSFQDSAFIFLLALLLFGPKKLPELARQLGKLMGEFRRASNEFRMQMEDELRMAEQAEKQKQIAAIEAAAPVNAVLDPPHTIQPPTVDAASVAEPIAESIPDPMDDHPHMRSEPVVAAETAPVEPIPIASSGDLHMMPPATGLPVGRSGSSSDLSPMLGSIPHAPADEPPPPPNRYTTESDSTGPHVPAPEAHVNG